MAERLSNPALTGISRHELAQLAQRVSAHQAARTERRRHQRRGGDRQPGARGGVFRQKITDAERVLVTVLHARGVCTLDLLAELFQVSRSSIGNAIRETRPLLGYDAATPTTAPRRFRTARDLLNFLKTAHPGHPDAPDTPS